MNDQGQLIDQQSLLGDSDPGPEESPPPAEPPPAPAPVYAEEAAPAAADEPAPAEPGPTTRVAIRELAAGKVRSVYRVEQVSTHQTKAGKPFLRLTFTDRTGAVAAVCWDDAADFLEFCKAGAVLEVQGEYEINERYGPQLTVRALRVAPEGDFDPADLEEKPLFAYDELERDWFELIASVTDPHLAELLGRLLGRDTASGRAFLEMPAAKKNHQAFRHGLLEHTLTVAKSVAAAAEIYPGIHRDLAVSGALLHDIGKLDAYEQVEGGIELTDAGKLQAEIPLGYYRIKRTIEEIEGFPPKLSQALLHIQLSHHGKLEHGSPVKPAIREAILVHLMDNLGGTLGSFDRLERTLAAEAEWSQWDRAIGDGGSAWFGHSPGTRGE